MALHTDAQSVGVDGGYLAGSSREALEAEADSVVGDNRTGVG